MRADMVVGVSVSSHHHHDSDIELTGGTEIVTPSHSHSGSLNKRISRRSSLLSISESSIDLGHSSHHEYEEQPEIEGSFCSAATHIIEPVSENDNHEEDEKLGLLGGKSIEKKTSFGASAASIVRSASSASIRVIKQVSQELKCLTSFSIEEEEEEAGPSNVSFERTNTAVSNALKGLKFITGNTDEAAWAKVEKKFDSLSTDGCLHRSLFAECIGLNKESTAFGWELFDAMSRRRNNRRDFIEKAQLKDFWNQISNTSFDSRLTTFFAMVDKNADGRITEDEIKEIISLSAFTNKLISIQRQADEYATLIMEELDRDHKGFIMVNDLKALLLDGLTEPKRGNSMYLSQVLSKKLKIKNEENSTRRWYRNTKYFLQNNWQRIWILVLWIGVMLGLFAYRFVQYRRKAAYEVMGHCICMAKGAAETLKLNMAIILLPVCRNTFTWLRRKTKLGIAVPFDDNINFHQVIAVAIATGVGIHATYHLVCDFPRLLHANSEEYKPMEPFFGDQPSNYWYFVRSWEGVTGIIMVVLMAIAFTLASPWFRKGKVTLPTSLDNWFYGKPPINSSTGQPDRKKKSLTGFNSFYYSHHLFVIVYALLIVHGIQLYFIKEWYNKTTWMYLAVPLTLYALERLTRTLRSSIKAVTVSKVDFYPGNVMVVYMSKPKGFKYKSGQYMSIKCSAVSPFEWHPFSITSSPGDDYLSVHIRALGDWTKSLHKKFSKSPLPQTEGNNGIPRAEYLQGDSSPSTIPPKIKILVDGPYGAPAQDYKEYEVVLLVGLGIGATPMISILKDIMNNVKAMEEEAGNTMEEGRASVLGASSSPQQHKKSFKTKKAYFYWVAKEQGFFDWFKGVMNEVSVEDHTGVIEIHNHCTSVYEKDDARSALIAMLQSLNHAKNGTDVVTGLHVKSHFGRPKWRTVYKHIAVKHQQTRVGVFYCGDPRGVEDHSKFSSEFSCYTSTKFEFHKENF